jgi:DNA-binding CsgD family transcriptional regulator
MDTATFSGIVDGIYEAALSPEHWPGALQKLGDALGCHCGALIDRNLRTMQGRLITTGFDASSQREFLEVWSARDILRLKTKAWRPGAVEADHDILPRSELLASDFYNGFMAPRDIHSVLRLTLALENKFLNAISLMRSRSAQEFDTETIEQCNLLIPHLQRASSIRFHAEDAGAMLGALSSVVDRSVAAVMFLERDGRVKLANKAAQAMAATADGFVIRKGQFEILDRGEDAALQRMIAGAAGGLSDVRAPRGGVVRLARRSGKTSYTVTVAPIGRETPWGFGEPMALVLVADPDFTPMAPEGILRQLFGLSAAEMRVAERLMMGDSPEQAAAFLDIKTATARWHLSSMYRKTGTRRQAELARLLSLAMI